MRCPSTARCLATFETGWRAYAELRPRERTRVIAQFGAARQILRRAAPPFRAAGEDDGSPAVAPRRA